MKNFSKFNESKSEEKHMDKLLDIMAKRPLNKNEKRMLSDLSSGKKLSKIDLFVLYGEKMGEHIDKKEIVVKKKKKIENIKEDPYREEMWPGDDDRKNNLVIRITDETNNPDFQDPGIEEVMVDFGLDKCVMVTFFVKDGDYMFDDEVLRLFPEIDPHHNMFDDLAEGSLMYLGHMNMLELKAYFENLDFNVSDTPFPDF